MPETPPARSPRATPATPQQPQPHLFPPGLLEAPPENQPEWTCVRTRPRWEKRFAGWLRAGSWAHFLPVVAHRTRSHRKIRVSELPLFPGYVFVAGNHAKKVFAPSGCVAYVLNPRSPSEARDIDEKLRALWRLLQNGHTLQTVREFTAGQEVEVVAGPLMGTRGRFLREGSGGKIVIWLDLLGAGVSAELDDADMVEPINADPPRPPR